MRNLTSKALPALEGLTVFDPRTGEALARGLLWEEAAQLALDWGEDDDPDSDFVVSKVTLIPHRVCTSDARYDRVKQRAAAIGWPAALREARVKMTDGTWCA